MMKSIPLVEAMIAKIGFAASFLTFSDGPVGRGIEHPVDQNGQHRFGVW